MALTIPDDLSIPDFLKRKPNEANTGTDHCSENVNASASNGACHAAVAERVVPVEGTGTLPPPGPLRDQANDAVSKAARRISRKHQRREEIALGKLRRK